MASLLPLVCRTMGLRDFPPGKTGERTNTLTFIERHRAPLLKDICRQVPPVDAGMPLRSLLNLFRDDAALLAVPVVAEGVFLGLISRKALFNLVSRPFALDIYLKRPLRVLLEDLPRETVAMPPEQDVNSAILALIAADRQLETDAFPVVVERRCEGVVSVAELMMSISVYQQQLLATLEKLHVRLNEEVAKASLIQHALLPVSEFHHAGVEVSADLTTSTEVGGDFYDYFVVDADRLGLVIADVSGHGVQSGMVTTAAKASLQTLLTRGITTPAALLNGMSPAIWATGRQNLLMTCQVVVVDRRERTLTVANAGHNFPYLCRDGTPRLLPLDEVTGLPLGFDREGNYREAITQLQAGDMLLLYTDGLVECCNEAEEQFGYDRLARLLARIDGLSPAAVKGLLLERMREFAGSEPYRDDVTTMVVGLRPEAEYAC